MISAAEKKNTAAAFDRQTACAACNGKTLNAERSLPLVTPEPYWLSGDQRVDVCGGCGYVQTVSPSTPGDYGKYYIELNKHHKRDEKNTALDRGYFKELIGYISRHSPAREGVLDFGSGALILSEMMQAEGFSQIDNWDVAGKPLAEGAYSIAVSTHVFEHLYEPARELATIRRALVPGGIFVLAVPDVEGYDRYYLGPYNYFDMEHINHFSPHTIALFLERGGFEMLNVTQTAREIAPGITYPEVRIAGRKTENTQAPAVSVASNEKLDTYFTRSARDLECLSTWLDGLSIPPQGKLGLWGVGSFAMRAMTVMRRPLDFCNDSDPRLAGRRFMGVPIFDVDAFDRWLAAQGKSPVQVLVIAVNHAGLKRFIRDRYGARVEVLCPYEAGVLE